MKSSFFIIIIFCVLITHNAYSQYEIRGRIVDQNNIPIAFANAYLTNPDDTTTIVSGGISDLKGEFRLAVPEKNNFLLFCSFVGYKTKKINVSKEDNFDSLLVIKLEISALALDEVVVTGQTITRDIEKTSYVITGNDRARARTSLSLLTNIPGILINETKNTITTMMRQSVKILINGRNATTIELMAINPAQVTKIEHYQIPPARFMASGYSEIINVITRQVIEGGNIYTWLNHSFSTGYGNYVLSGNYNKNNSQLAVYYYYSFRNYKSRVIDNQYRYSTENDFINFVRTGHKSPFGYHMHIANISYVNTKDSDYTFSIKASPNFTSIFRKNDYGFIRQHNTEINTGLGKHHSDEYEFTPSADIYFQKEFSGNREVLINVVGNVFKSEGNSIRTELAGNNIDTLFFTHIDNENLKQSLISEIQFSQRFSNSSFNIGFRSKEGRLRQSIFNNPFFGIYNLRTSEQYAYGEFRSKINTFSFQGSLGITFNSFSREEGGSYTFRALKPVINLFYQPAENSTLRLHYIKAPTLPTLNQLNDHKRPIDLLLFSTGNTNLKPFNTHYTSLSYELTAGKLTSNVRFQYSYAKHPILYRYLHENGSFMFAPNNEKSRKEMVLSSSIRTSFFENDLLNISIYGAMINFVNDYNNKSRIGLRGYLISVSANLNYRNFILDASFTNPMKSLNNESISISGVESDISLQYKYNSFLFGFGVFLPFSRADGSQGQTARNTLVYNNYNARIYDMGSMLSFKLTYNFSFGKQLDWNKRIDNKDTDTGLIK